MDYQVNEIFNSIQGEGALVGIPSTFIRLQGCPVKCSFCDTKFTWEKGGTKMSTREIVDKVRHPHVVITGGEPLLYELDDLMIDLRRADSRRYIQLETSGLNEIKGLCLPSWLTWSPKENLGWNAPELIWQMADEVKWVVDEGLELSLVDTWWEVCKERVGPPPIFVMMPEGCPPRSDMVEKVLEWLYNRPHWRYGDRIQYRIGVK